MATEPNGCEERTHGLTISKEPSHYVEPSNEVRLGHMTESAATSGRRRRNW